MSSPKTSLLAKIKTTGQVDLLEKLLGINFSKQDHKALIGGEIRKESFSACEDKKCKTETLYTVGTKQVRHNDDGVYDYYNWEELNIDPKTTKPDKSGPLSGVGDGFMLKCKPAKRGGGDPCDGPGMVLYKRNSIKAAQGFARIFGDCPKDGLSKKDNDVRKAFELPACEKPEDQPPVVIPNAKGTAV